MRRIQALREAESRRKFNEQVAEERRLVINKGYQAHMHELIDLPYPVSLMSDPKLSKGYSSANIVSLDKARVSMIETQIDRLINIIHLVDNKSHPEAL